MPDDNSTIPKAKVPLSRAARSWRFVQAVAAVACIWTVILPWLANRPGMAEHIRWLEARGIDAGAMYYTELDAMQPILRKLERPNSTPRIAREVQQP